MLMTLWCNHQKSFTGIFLSWFSDGNIYRLLNVVFFPKLISSNQFRKTDWMSYWRPLVLSWISFYGGRLDVVAHIFVLDWSRLQVSVFGQSSGNIMSVLLTNWWLLLFNRGTLFKLWHYFCHRSREAFAWRPNKPWLDSGVGPDSGGLQKKTQGIFYCFVFVVQTVCLYTREESVRISSSGEYSLREGSL